jgi:hypothetical protein
MIIVVHRDKSANLHPYKKNSGPIMMLNCRGKENVAFISKKPVGEKKLIFLRNLNELKILS